MMKMRGLDYPEIERWEKGKKKSTLSYYVSAIRAFMEFTNPEDRGVKYLK